MYKFKQLRVYSLALDCADEIYHLAPLPRFPDPPHQCNQIRDPKFEIRNVLASPVADQ